MNRTLFMSILLLGAMQVYGQRPTEIDSLVNKMEDCFKRGSFDSTLYYSRQIEQFIKKDHKPSEKEFTALQKSLLYAGRAYKEKKEWVRSNEQLAKALKRARALGSSQAIVEAFTELNILHESIARENIKFPYDQPGSTEEVLMYFPVSKVEIVSEDSLRLQIRVGRYDGLEDTVKKGGVISLYTVPERPFGLVNAYLRERGDNYCTAMAVHDTSRMVKTGDLVELRVRVPLSWRQLDIRETLLKRIGYFDNYKQALLSPRFIYYFNDSLMNRDIATSLRASVEEIVNFLGEDTATDKDLKQRAEKGLFAGDNVIRGMSRIDPDYIRLFINFVNEYPRKYLGGEFKFSEVYATWIINNTPLAKADLRQFLYKWHDKPGQENYISNLFTDIKREDLLDRWFNEGMQMANIDNLDSALVLAQLIQRCARQEKDSAHMGWGIYLEAYQQKRMGSFDHAEALFKKAKQLFSQQGNEEGIAWSENAIANINTGRKIEMKVQTGHLFSYLMATAPNSRYLATAGHYDKMIKIWDLSLGREIYSFNGHEDYITSINYSPDGKYIVTASEDKTIKLWNAYDYSLIKTIPTPAIERVVIFTPDGKQLVAGGSDSLIKFIDPRTGKISRTLKKHTGSVKGLAFLPTNTDYLFSCGNDSLIYKWDLTNNDWDHWYREKGRILNIQISNDGKFLCAVHTDTMATVWNLQTNRKHASMRTNYSTTGNLDIAYPAISPDSKYLAFPFQDDSLAVVELATLKEMDYRIRTNWNMGMYDMTFTPDGSFLVARVNNGGPLRVLNFSSYDFEKNSGINYKDLKNYYDMPSEVQFSPDGNSLIVAHAGVSSLDLRNGSTKFLYTGALGYMNSQLLLNDGKTGLTTRSKIGGLSLVDINDPTKKTTLYLPDSTESISRYEIAAGNQYIFIGGVNKTITGFEWPSGKRLFSGNYPGGKERGFLALRYDSLRYRLFANNNNGEIIALDASNGKEIRRWKISEPQTIEVTDRFIYVGADSGRIYKFDAISLEPAGYIRVHDGGGEVYYSCMSHDRSTLVVYVKDELVAIDTRTEKVLYHQYDHDYMNGTISISPDNKLLATGGFDTKVHLFELSSGKKILTIYTPREKDFMLVDEEGYYLAPKNTLAALGFRYNNGYYGFEQFDTKFNRPDLVLSRIGKTDTVLLKNFHSAYLKRLRKQKIEEKDLAGDLHLPVARLKDRFALKPATTLLEYELNIDCLDLTYELRSVQVLVNSNPLFGSGGFQIPAGKHKYELKTKIPLSVGNNQVKVYCTNEKGAMSLAENLEINSTGKAPEGKTWFIGIAVSNYKDSLRNLQYAAKDVRDLAAMFKNLVKKNLVIDTLIDKKAKRENIMALRQKLLRTTVNDKVVISVNGHGLLSDSLDFYYATQDIDFQKPTIRGLKYEELESLLDGIPARKKLLLIDACHSGALDKEEILAAKQKKTLTLVKTDEGSVKGISSRGGITSSLATGVDVGSSYEIMQQLFADISNGNGAVVISAAGGMEYAYESGKWNNGVFTWCIRMGIAEEQADVDGGNNDRSVDVMELKQYVSKKVSELTNGRQKPVARRENIEFNWIVW